MSAPPEYELSNQYQPQQYQQQPQQYQHQPQQYQQQYQQQQYQHQQQYTSAPTAPSSNPQYHSQQHHHHQQHPTTSNTGPNANGDGFEGDGDDGDPYAGAGAPTDGPSPEKDAPPAYTAFGGATYRSNDSSLPNGWESYQDQVTGNRYYCNMATMETTWTHPTTGIAQTNLPQYEAPDYYAQVAQEQRQAEQEYSPLRPSFDPNATNQPFDETSPYSPMYYQNKIAQTIDPNILNQDQMDSMAPIAIDHAKYSQNLTCKQRICGTMGKNKFLSILSFILWAAIGLSLALFFTVGEGEVDTGAPLFAIMGVPYAIYFCAFLIPSGCFPLFWLCCGCSPCLSDKVVESLRVRPEPTTTKLLNYIDTLAQTQPVITLSVRCYHWRTRTTIHRVRQQNGTYRTVRRTHREQVTTFRGSRQIPILRWRSLSPPSVVVADIVEQCPSNVVSVSYKHIYQLHPKQQNLINDLKNQYYYTHCFRDDHTVVSLSYNVNTPLHDTDVVVKEKNCKYWTSQIFFFNPISFFLWGYASLLLPIMMIFRTYIRPVPFTDIKYIHIDLPNPARDVITYNRPRYRIAWVWR